MFTGIITNIAVVKNISYQNSQDLSISLVFAGKINSKLKIGCSVACNGVCLTLVKKTGNFFWGKTNLHFQASKETLSKTNVKNWQIGDKINIEFALKMGDELGGHLVSGHIDAMAEIKEINAINNDSWQFLIELPKNLESFIAPKGSVVLNGVSLTVNEVYANNFSINIISHTFNNTNFSSLKIGDKINLEIDLIARYLEKITANFIIKNQSSVEN